jgi:hypothetical protein
MCLKFDYKSQLGVLNTTVEFEDTKGVIRICKSNKDRQEASMEGSLKIAHFVPIH